jgi:hypothetical protein
MGVGAMGGGGAVAGGATCGGMACAAEVPAGPAVMSYVGNGCGDYIQETSYKYVGCGAGEFDIVAARRPNYTWMLTCGVVLALALVIVIVVLLMLPDQATTTTTGAALPYDCNAGPVSTMEIWSPAKKAFCCQRTGVGCETPTQQPALPPAVCLIWGDPHIKTFDKGRADFYGEGIKWLVKSADMSIQARYKATPFTNGLAATNAISIGGHFMQGHVLKVGPMENGQITYDDQVILTSFGTFNAAGVGTVTYSDQGDLVDGAMGHLQKHIVHASLPGGVKVDVMRWSNHINVRITMAPDAGQDGHCGNFNGNPADDTTEAIRARIGLGVPQAESLFRAYVPAVPGKKETLADCPAAKKVQAQQACQAAGRTDESCVFDACFAGSQYVNEGM